jgi:hypothetical protein
LADPQKHPQSFYKGLRLVGLDGTQCSVSNTPRLLAAVPKAASRRLRAALGKLQIVTLIELGLHNPLKAAQQEVLAVVLAMAVVTRLRIEAGETLGVPVLELSFLNVLQFTRQLWESFAWSEGASTPQLSAQLCAHYFAALRRRALLPTRRPRSCPRVIRQPVSS